MAMPELARRWTREEVLALPDDGNRYELVDGELLVSPRPRALHQLAVSAMYDRLKPYVQAYRLGTVLFSPADLDLRSGQLLQPDLFVLATTTGRPLREWTDAGIPPLVVEVLSPSTARFDRVTKRRRYQRSGIPTYWIVDVDARLVEAWSPADSSPRIVDEILAWQPNPLVTPLSIDLPATFREIWGE
ncbi:MAG: Uma2 family endonuclease [Gemmatimonadales bacterium]